MAESSIAQETINNITRLNLNSFLSIYKSKLKQLAGTKYGDEGLHIIQTFVLPKLENWVNSLNFDDLVRNLNEVSSAGWIRGHGDANLSRELDKELVEMARLLKEVRDGTKHEIEQLQKKQSRADLIADVFTVVKRDIGGHALELQHTKHYQRSKHYLPVREYYKFKHTIATKLTVLEALKYKLNERDNFPDRNQQRLLKNTHYYQDIRCIIRDENADTSDGKIDQWLQGLAEAYNKIAKKYPSLTAKDLVNYLTEKEQRNQNSHFRDNLKEVIEENPNISMDSFIRNNTQLLDVFPQEETNLLSQTFNNYREYLNSGLQFFPNNQMTVIPNDYNQQPYHANFICECDQPNMYRIAPVLPYINKSGIRTSEPCYWQPSNIIITENHILYGYQYIS